MQKRLKNSKNGHFFGVSENCQKRAQNGPPTGGPEKSCFFVFFDFFMFFMFLELKKVEKNDDRIGTPYTIKKLRENHFFKKNFYFCQNYLAQKGACTRGVHFFKK